MRTAIAFGSCSISPTEYTQPGTSRAPFRSQAPLIAHYTNLNPCNCFNHGVGDIKIHPIGAQARGRSAVCMPVISRGKSIHPPTIPPAPRVTSEMAPQALENIRSRLGNDAGGAVSGDDARRLAASARLNAAQAGRQPEIFSNARLVVRGPNRPIVAMTIPIATAMKTKTPWAPNSSRMKAITNELKMTESRLQE